MIRIGRAADMGDITRVRTSVTENHLSVEQMAAIGITPEGLIADMQAGDLGCWVAEAEGEVVGFSMADRRDGNVFALFVLPEHEGKGHGSALLDVCETWIKSHGIAEARLDTGAGTKAHAFYLRRGWRLTGEKAGHFAEDDVFRKPLA
ncbi:N-acetyltransferase family protein [Aestuariivirga sp.]|uniref:GNAT family N-acetyltransferase n=1 Tax=Aestuariivirga sp. TaxID=2650926 RepID=UPI0035941404